MALLVDGSCPTLAELKRYEGAIAEVANTEGIDLGEKMLLAREEIVTELGKFLKEQGTFAGGDSGSSQVVLNEPLRRWLVLHSIASVYREARFGQVSDRYGAKWKEYSQLAYQAKHDLMSSGIGVAWNAISRPAKVQVSAVAGSVAAGTYFVRISWVGHAGAESEASDPVVYELQTAGGLRVTAGQPPAGATGWNVYAGQFESEVALQNAEPNATSAYWDWTAGALVAGRSPSPGQLADVSIRVFNSLLRG